MKLNELTICEMLKDLEAGKFSAEELATDIASQVQKMDKLGALIEFNEDALRSQAKVSDARRQNKRAGKLEGIPLVLKDNIDTKDMATTGGT